MEKPDGTFQLAVWNETDTAHNVTLSLGTTAQTVRIYDPLTGTSAVQNLFEHKFGHGERG
jgi:hypothetical protein